MTYDIYAANLAAMIGVLLFASFSVALAALAVRRALPFVIAGAAFWSAQQATHDLLTAWTASLVMLVLSSTFLDRASWSQRASVRFSVRGIECLAGALVAAFLAWSFARAFGDAETTAQTAILCLRAAILGGLITASRYRIA